MLSLCMIVKNEAHNLPRCLESVKDIVDEMIVVDTGSKDHTIQIAKDYDAKVFSFPWNDNFSDARNYSLQQATGDWILLMDADDELEKKDHPTLLRLIENNEADAYIFKTLCYMSSKSNCDTVCNLNVRLIKNGKGYFFSNAIHEQIYSNIKTINPSAKILTKDITIYHYGYIQDQVDQHKKRERNIRILKKELSLHPDYFFHHYNLGNEYFALGALGKALEHYSIAYNNFNPNEGYSSKLLLKMILCLLHLGQSDLAFDIIEKGLKYYANFTDLIFVKGQLFTVLEQYTLAIEQFNTCLAIGDAPLNLLMITGTGTFRSADMLGTIYKTLEDYDKAIDYYTLALKYQPGYNLSFRSLIDCLCKSKLTSQALMENIHFIQNITQENHTLTLYEVLIDNAYYDLTLEIINQQAYQPLSDPYTIYYQGMCHLYLCDFEEAYKSMQFLRKEDILSNKAILTQTLIRLVQGKLSSVGRLLRNKSLDFSSKELEVYNSFYRLTKKQKPEVLSEDPKISRIYSEIIISLLNTLLILKEYDLFEIGLQLFNTISDAFVLLDLGKLYFKHEKYILAYETIIQSIKDFNLLDTESAKIIYIIKQKGLIGIEQTD